MTPEEQLDALYNQEDISPQYYMDVGELPESGEVKITGKLPIGVDHGISAQVCRTPVIAPKCNDNLHKILRDGKINHLPNMFLAMAQDANERKLPSATLVVGLYGDDTTGVLPGQYVCELHLVIHQMPQDKEVEQNVDVKR